MNNMIYTIHNRSAKCIRCSQIRNNDEFEVGWKLRFLIFEYVLELEDICFFANNSFDFVSRAESLPEDSKAYEASDTSDLSRVINICAIGTGRILTKTVCPDISLLTCKFSIAQRCRKENMGHLFNTS